VASAVLAPIGDPLHEDNRALSVALIRALASGARSCADIVHTVRASGAPLDGYVIIGDPAVPVAATPDAMERCGRIFAPAPDALLSGP
jgi:hypothetical protein